MPKKGLLGDFLAAPPDAFGGLLPKAGGGLLGGDFPASVAPAPINMVPLGNKRRMKYPVELPPSYSDTDFEARGGRVVSTTPDGFLAKVKPLHLDDESRDNIADLRRHVESGGMLDPPIVYVENGRIVKHDGRHRANLAKEMGMDELPVIVIDVTGVAAPTDFGTVAAQDVRRPNR